MSLRTTSHATASGPAEPATDWLALDQQLCFAMYSCSLAMTKLYKPLLAPLGLTYPQYLAMLALWEGQAMTVSALGQRLQLDSGTLTPLLKRLEAAGLATRQRDTDDERRLLVSLTPAGRALKQRARSVPRRIACAVQCEQHEITQLTQRLTALREQLQQASA